MHVNYCYNYPAFTLVHVAQDRVNSFSVVMVDCHFICCGFQLTYY